MKSRDFEGDTRRRTRGIWSWSAVIIKDSKLSLNYLILGLLLYIFLTRGPEEADTPAVQVPVLPDAFPAPFPPPSLTVDDTVDSDAPVDLAALGILSQSDIQGMPLRLEMESPLYNIRVLRTILQHQNNTWKDKKGEAQGYFIQSLLWMVVDDAARPDYPSRALDVMCHFPEFPSQQEDSLLEVYDVKARVHPYPIHPGDRAQGHNFQFFVDCEIPEHMQDRADELADVRIDVALAAGELERQDEAGNKVNSTMIISTSDVRLNITRPMEKVEFAVCLSPMDFEEGEIPLWQMLEWRTSLADLGVERVNWHYRGGFFEKFVATYNRIRETKDIFIHSPNLLDHPYREPPTPWEHYADQDVWYEECVLNNAYSSDYILVLDIDELFMVDWTKPEPLQQFKRFMRSMPPSIGTVEFDRIEMARPHEKGAPPADDLMQLSFDCYNEGKEIQKLVRTGTVVKVMYKSHSVIAVNQHKSRQMYPMPADVAIAAGKRKGERYQWHLQHSYNTGIWPKLMHYRWWDWSGGDKCDTPSPLEGMTAYQEYLTGLRKEVASMAEELAFINLYRLPVQ